MEVSSRVALAAASVLAPAATAQDPERIQALEDRIQALEEQNQAMSRQFESFEFRDVIPPVGDSQHGMGPAASKVYAVRDQGLSIGGYGEYQFRQNSGKTDVFDALRAVLYIGYKFDDRFVFNSEIEIEHGTTSSSSGTTDSDGSVSLEFGYIDWLHSDELNVRGGLILPPLGFINELHEPTTFFSANRPETERRIIPTTWRAGGVGVHGESGGFAYRAYAINSLDGEEFDAKGLRGGRQKGNRSAADDIAVVGRLDWVDTPGLLAGVSAFWGDTGQDGDASGVDIPDLNTTILDVHVEWRTGPWTFRGLYATAWIDDTRAFNANTGENLAQRLEGYYVEGGFDIMSELNPDSGQSLTPFVRFESIDTQADLASGFSADESLDDTIWTFGVNYKPIDQIVLKVDFEDFDESNDRFNILLGYVF